MYVGRFVAAGTVTAVIVTAVILGANSAGADESAMSLAPVAGQAIGVDELQTRPLTDEEQLLNVPLLDGPDPAKGDIGLRTWDPVSRPSPEADLRGLRVDLCCPVGSFAQPIDNTINFYHGNVIGVYPDSIEGNSITLKNFSVELEFTGSVQFTYTVYHKDRALAGSKWRPIKVINKTHVGTGRNFYDSGNLNVELPLDEVAGEPAIAFYALGIGWGNSPVTYGRSVNEDLPDPLCVGTIQGYWGLDRLPPSPLAPDDPLTLPSPLYTRGALSMDICFDGPPAACCVGTSCVEVNQPIDCENMGGVFTRGGVHCPGPGDPTLCPLPEGACCFGAESCDYTTEYRCEDDLAGLWEENRDCAPFNPCGPPIGACCTVDGDCIDDLSDTECQAIDGIYRGDFTLCVNEAASCQVRGACCLPGGTCEIRVEGEMPGQCRASQGQVYNGDGTHCQKLPDYPYDPCVTTKGACCYYDGSCAFVTEYECYDNGTGTPGTWNEGDSCPAANCEDQVLGSCCSDTDCLGDMILTQCLQCADANSNGSCPGGTVPDTDGLCPDTGWPGECREDTGRIWWEGRPCAFGPCRDDGQIGACCLLGDCLITNQVDCVDVLGGQFNDADSLGFMACSMTGFPEACDASGLMGACCQSDAFGDPFCEILSEAACNATATGWYAGNGIACSGLVCATGVCCEPDDTCTEVQRLQCELEGNTPGDPGTGCPDEQFAPNPCKPSGACCFPDTACEIWNADQCLARGGEYQGDDTECTPGLCPPIGACCVEIVPGTFLCEDGREESTCMGAGLTFGGAGSVCGADGCATGACCELDGTCTNGIRAACDLNPDGEFLEGEMCSNNSCPPRGACCLDDGQGPFCQELTAEDCTTNGGFFQGIGVPCDGDVCAVVACCVPDGGCQDLFPDACIATNGVVGEVGQLCSSGDLCTPGACCLDTGSGPICVASLNALQCQSSQFAVPDGFKGAGVPCTPGICDAPTGVCCRLDGTCEDDGGAGLLEADCTLWGGAEFFLGAECATFTCTDKCTAFAGNPPSDFDGNGLTDLIDFAAFQRCFGDTPSDECMCIFDSDENGVIDIIDYAAFIAEMTGPVLSLGACCRLNGTCEDSGGAGLVQADCAQWGGAVFVLGDDCASLNCPDQCAAFPGTPPGDFDGAAGVNLKDYGAFQLCYGSSPDNQCMCIFDGDENGVIDLIDFGAFQASITGPS